MDHTQVLAAKNLFLAVLIEALSTAETAEDYDYFLSPDCEAYLCLLGFSQAAIFRFRLRVLLGLFDARRLRLTQVHAGRFQDRRQAERAENSLWPHDCHRA